MEPQSPEIPQMANIESAIIDIDLKEREIKKKERKFKIIFFTILGIVLVFIIIPLTALLIKKINDETKKSFTTDTPVVTNTGTNNTGDWKSYDNANLKLSLKYPPTTRLFEGTISNGEIIERLEIVYSPTNLENTDSTNMKEGYVFRVTPLVLKERTLEEMTDVKREGFYVSCPKGVEITASLPGVLGEITTRTFEVRNCNGDFKVTYLGRFGIFYEIVQLYRGDLGFRQQYKSTTQEIINSLAFYPEDKPVEEDYKTFKGTQNKLTFTYPKEFVVDCCTVPEPPLAANTQKIVSMGIKLSEEKYGAFAIFSESFRDEETIESYMTRQKQKLISDYKIINNGAEPVVVEEQLKIGDRPAIRLKGISWKGNDLIYIVNAGDYGGNTIVISIVNKLGEDFDNTMSRLLKSIKFPTN